MKAIDATFLKNLTSLILIGRWFFAIAFLGMGVLHFVFQDFIIGRAPAWPENIAGKVIWAYLSGIIFILISIATISGRKARLALVFAAMLIFLWALLRHIPIVVSASFLSGEWTSAGKALTFIGGALAIASTFPKLGKKRDTSLVRFMNLDNEFILIGQICLGIFLIITGIQHFIFTEFVASLIPFWFPGNAEFWTYFAGIALISGGIGLFIPKTAQLAAFLSGLMVFSWFWIVHIPISLNGVSNNIAVFEALAVSGIALLLAGCLGKRSFTK